MRNSYNVQVHIRSIRNVQRHNHRQSTKDQLQPRHWLQQLVRLLSSFFPNIRIHHSMVYKQNSHNVQVHIRSIRNVQGHNHRQSTKDQLQLQHWVQLLARLPSSFFPNIRIRHSMVCRQNSHNVQVHIRSIRNVQGHIHRQSTKDQLRLQHWVQLLARLPFSFFPNIRIHHSMVYKQNSHNDQVHIQSIRNVQVHIHRQSTK